MPILFEPAQPFSQSIAEQYGRNQASGGGGGGNGRGGQGVSLAQIYQTEMQGKQRAGEAQADFMLKNMMFNKSQELEAAKVVASQSYSNRDAGMAQADMARDRQRAELQAWSQNQEMTQAEAVRLQRLKQGDSSIEEQRTQGLINEDEATMMRSQLRTGIDTLEMKKKQTEQKKMAQQNEQLQYQFDQHKSLDLKNQALESKAFPDRWASFPDEQMMQAVQDEMSQNPEFQNLPPQVQQAAVMKEVTRRGGMIQGFQKKPGEWEIHQPKAAAGGKDKAEGALPTGAMNEEKWQAARDRADKNTRDWLKLKYFDQGKEPPLGEYDKVRESFIKQDEGGYESYLQSRKSGGKPQQPASPLADAKPFNASTLEDASRAQKMIVSELDRVDDQIKEAQIDPAYKEAGTYALGMQKKLLAQYGSPEALKQKAAGSDKRAKEDWDKWQKVDDTLALVTKKLPKPAAPAAPPPEQPQPNGGVPPGAVQPQPYRGPADRIRDWFNSPSDRTSD